MEWERQRNTKTTRQRPGKQSRDAKIVMKDKENKADTGYKMRLARVF